MPSETMKPHPAGVRVFTRPRRVPTAGQTIAAEVDAIRCLIGTALADLEHRWTVGAFEASADAERSLEAARILADELITALRT